LNPAAPAPASTYIITCIIMVRCLSLLAAAGSAALSLAYRTDGPNPFANKPLYVNPSYVMELESSIATADGNVKSTLMSVRNVASAYWLDQKAKIKSDGTPGETLSAEGILRDASLKTPVPVVTLIVYDLPNRDCHAHASNGEICCNYKDDGVMCDYEKGGDCKAGIAEYKTEYIDPLVTVLKAWHTKVPIVVVIEPDSLPNLATNTGDPRCGNTATTAAYKEGIAYAVHQVMMMMALKAHNDLAQSFSVE
jgi:cellulose 1,4-beta-cellobiosidase